jgi:hypothetical protein
MLRSVEWLLVTDVSGHFICSIFKGQAVQEHWLTFEDGKYRFSRNVRNY